MDAFEDSACWDFLDYSLIDDSPFLDFSWASTNPSQEVNIVHERGTPQEKASEEKDCVRKRGRNDTCSRAVSKACREKLRREKLNDRFVDLSSVLEPGRPVRSEKPAILDDAIRILTQLRAEAQELKETNEKLLEEIKALKAEKNELREEKLSLKADKEKMEHRLRATSISSEGYVPAHPAAYHAGAKKVAVYPSYGLVPMWRYLPPSACDTSRDHELRPPAA